MAGGQVADRDDPYRIACTLGFWGFIGLTAATFAVAAFLPVYTDEIVWKLLQGRYFYDGGRAGVAFATCGVRSVALPWLLTPFRMFDSLIYENISGPAMVRAIGIAQAGAAGLLIWYGLHRALHRVCSGRLLLCLVLAVLTLGIMPFLLILNRPEQVMLIGMVLFAIPPLLMPASPPRAIWADMGLGALLALFCGYFFSAHPRAVFALPLVLVCIHHIFTRRWVAVLVGVLVSIFCGVALLDWAGRTKCADPLIAYALALDSSLDAILQGEFTRFLLYFTWRFLRDPAKFLYFSVLRMDQISTENMIPPGTTVWALAASVLAEAVLAGLMLAGGVAFWLLARRAWRRWRVTTAEVALACVWAFYGWAVLARATKASYEAALIEPVMAIAALGSLWVARRRLVRLFGARGVRRAGALGFAVLIGVSVFSQTVLIGTYLPAARGAWAVGGYPVGQKFSVSTADYAVLRQKILATARRCGIEPVNTTRHPVLDELTVFAMQPVYLPIIATYIDEQGWGKGIRDYRAFLAGVGSDGMVVGCQWVPEQLRGDAIQDGAFCCLPSFRR